MSGIAAALQLAERVDETRAPPGIVVAASHFPVADIPGAPSQQHIPIGTVEQLHESFLRADLHDHGARRVGFSALKQLQQVARSLVAPRTRRTLPFRPAGDLIRAGLLSDTYPVDMQDVLVLSVWTAFGVIFSIRALVSRD